MTHQTILKQVEVGGLSCYKHHATCNTDCVGAEEARLKCLMRFVPIVLVLLGFAYSCVPLGWCAEVDAVDTVTSVVD